MMRLNFGEKGSCFVLLVQIFKESAELSVGTKPFCMKSPLWAERRVRKIVIFINLQQNEKETI